MTIDIKQNYVKVTQRKPCINNKIKQNVQKSSATYYDLLYCIVNTFIASNSQSNQLYKLFVIVSLAL